MPTFRECFNYKVFLSNCLFERSKKTDESSDTDIRSEEPSAALIAFVFLPYPMPHPERLTLHTRGNKLNRKLPSTSGAARSLSDGASNWLQRDLLDTTVEMFQQMTEIMDDNIANECRGRVVNTPAS
jgi:hypothetical protein